MNRDYRLVSLLAAHALDRGMGYADAALVAKLRGPLGEIMGQNRVADLDDLSVLEEVRRRVNRAHVFELGEAWQATREKPKPETPRQAAAQQQQAEPEPEEEVEPKKTWITIQLEDEDGNPIANEKYKVVLPDGSVQEGKTSSAGKATFRDIDPGTAEITFIADERPQTTLTLELKDDEGRPAKSEKYKVELPDGSVHEGFLDVNGRVQFLNVDPGDAKITFSDDSPKNKDLTIQLEDEDGKALPGESYVVQLPDGREVRGVLDDQGKAQFKNVDPGDAKVTFLDPDKLPNVSIQLLTEGEQPIPDEAYTLELPDGTEIKGTLDGDGKVTVRHMDWGTAKIKFGEDSDSDTGEETGAEGDSGGEDDGA